jgi:hypothetical protein
MKVTKRQLKRIIKEERAKLLREQGPLGVSGQIDTDMQRLLGLLQEAEVEANKIHQRVSSDVEYSQHAGGREAEDVERALSRVWQAFGGQSLRAEGFNE